MTDITIPAEALEAAARAHAKANEGHDEWWPLHVDKVRAACIAMLRNWPGMKLNPSWELRTHKRSVEMILPMSEPPRMDRKSAVAERLFGDD